MTLEDLRRQMDETLNHSGGVNALAKEIKRSYDESPPDVKAELERKVDHLLRSIRA